MFSNLTQNSVLYVMDLSSNPKIISGLVEHVSVPKPKYNAFNPTLETTVDITANIAGDRREFKGVPNNSVADFGEAAFVIAENKDVLDSYINSMMQNSQRIVDSYDKHVKRVNDYKEALEELHPSSKVESKAIQEMQNRINTLQEGMNKILERLGTENAN